MIFKNYSLIRFLWQGHDRVVLVIDLAREMPKGSRYYYDLIHYTNAGAEKVADLVAAHLTPFLAQKFPSILEAARLKLRNPSKSLPPPGAACLYGGVVSR